MASSILRWVSRNASSWTSRNLAARSPNPFGGFGVRMISMSVSDESVLCPTSTLPSRNSPWLMLPPAFEGRDMVYKFYSLAENRVLSVSKRGSGGGGGGELPDDNAEFVGSSHGWLVLFNLLNCDLFLSSPLSCRHIKLPSIHTLPIPEANLRSGWGCVSKVIISCSPDSEDCRAMMSFGPLDRLAFCCPGHSTKWTPIGDLFFLDEMGRRIPRNYQEFVYSSKRKLFFCVTSRNQLEAWDLREPGSPRMMISMDVPAEDEEKHYTLEELETIELSYHMNFLVVAEPNDELLLVRRHVLESVDRNGSYVEQVFGLNKKVDARVIFENCFPHKTIGFSVYKYDQEENCFRYMDRSLDDLALFIGYNHGFALSAGAFPELKPNSIYFTDAEEMIPRGDDWPFGGQDLGIFNYENRTLSACYYPCDVQSIKRIVPAPMWFTPSTH